MITVKAMASAIAAELAAPGTIKALTEEQFKRTKVEQAKASIAARRALRREAEASRKRGREEAAQRIRECPALAQPMPPFVKAFGHTFATGQGAWKDEKEFLAALAKLCSLYGVAISGCGCCGSPSVGSFDSKTRDLIGYVNTDCLTPIFAHHNTPTPGPGEDLESLGIGKFSE